MTDSDRSGNLISLRDPPACLLLPGGRGAGGNGRHSIAIHYYRELQNLRDLPSFLQPGTIESITMTGKARMRASREGLMKENSRVRKIAFVGDHLPRKCGIATFTSDLLAAVAAAHPQSQCLSVSVNDIQGGYEYPEVVRFEIAEKDLSSYLRAADFLNIGNVDIVCLQHEFGIFGGTAGGHILALLRELRMPVVTTLHTVLREPKADQRRVMHELVALSTRLVVMAERGRQMLQEIYQAPPAKIDLIPHGIPDVGFVDPTDFKDQFGVEGRVVLLTFGLLSPNKGIEYVLNALPPILAEFPDVVYIVLGATHPNELREHGEAYRLSLEILAKKNKLEKNVIFY